MMTTEQARNELLAEAAADYVGLWSVALLFREESEGPHDMLGILEMLKSLLESHQLVVGFPTPDGRGFEAWSLSPEDAIERMAREWRELGRDPDIGEIAWFTTPP
jgi:hypothetical protein